MIKIQTGALIDTRLEEEKQKDFLHEEIAFGNVNVEWTEKKEYKEYFPYDQSTSLSCVAGGGAITEEYFSNKTFIPSRKDIYIRRANRPHGGMAMHDLFNVCIKGMASEEQVLSQKLGENAMNAEYALTSDIIGTRARHKFDTWVSIKNYTDINTLASVVDHTPIVAFWFFDDSLSWQEWWNVYPKVVNARCDLFGNGTARHQATIVDRTLINDKKYFVVQDTAGVGHGDGKNKNLRFVDEAFIKARLYSAGYGINNSDEIVTSKPKVKINKTLKVGDRGVDVEKLQAVLIYEGLLKIQKPTGVFAGMTRRAVIDYQNKYRSEILTPSGLKSGTGIVGRFTVNHINKIYA